MPHWHKVFFDKKGFPEYNSKRIVVRVFLLYSGNSGQVILGIMIVLQPTAKFGFSDISWQ